MFNCSEKKGGGWWEGKNDSAHVCNKNLNLAQQELLKTNLFTLISDKNACC